MSDLTLSTMAADAETVTSRYLARLQREIDVGHLSHLQSHLLRRGLKPSFETSRT